MCKTLTERQIKILFDIISARFRGFEPVKASPLNTALETADQQTTTTGKGIPSYDMAHNFQLYSSLHCFTFDWANIPALPPTGHTVSSELS